MVLEALEKPLQQSPKLLISMESREKAGVPHRGSVLSLQQNFLMSRDSLGQLDLQRAQRLGWLALGSRDLGKDLEHRQENDGGRDGPLLRESLKRKGAGKVEGTWEQPRWPTSHREALTTGWQGSNTSLSRILHSFLANGSRRGLRTHVSRGSGVSGHCRIKEELSLWHPAERSPYPLYPCAWSQGGTEPALLVSTFPGEWEQPPTCPQQTEQTHKGTYQVVSL